MHTLRCTDMPYRPEFSHVMYDITFLGILFGYFPFLALFTCCWSIYLKMMQHHHCIFKRCIVMDKHMWPNTSLVPRSHPVHMSLPVCRMQY